MKVSLCVVAYNEENFLPNLFLDFKAQTYPHELIEVVLVDSVSTDGTRRIMEKFSDEENGFCAVKVVENHKKVQAAGWNVAISNSDGDAIIRIDAHTHIPADFVLKNIENLQNGEDISGGMRPCLIENENSWTHTLLEVENSLFGSSINQCRRGAEDKSTKIYVKTMFHATYKREVFASVGGFNENLLRTEDNEMHCRIRKAGFKLCFDSSIISYQYARSNLKKMIKQKYGNGKWIGLTLGVCPACVSLFHLVPLCFVLGIVFTSVLGGIGFWQLGALMWTMYAVFGVVSTVVSIKHDGFLLPKLLMPFLFLILHVAYGIGTAIGIIKMPFKRKELSHCDEIERVQLRIKQKLAKTC